MKKEVPTCEDEAAAEPGVSPFHTVGTADDDAAELGGSSNVDDDELYTGGLACKMAGGSRNEHGV